MTEAAIILVFLGMAFILLRGIKAPTTYDRILVANAFGSKAMALIVLAGVLTDDPVFLDIALIYALVNFITTIGFLKFFKYHSLGKE